MSSVLDTIQRLFPKARITSGYRGPDHPLTKANPKSWHAQGSAHDPRAIDVAPIPGVSFDQYIGGLKNAGLNLVESIDEARNPRRHTTGPNWHIAIGDKSKMPAPIPSRRQGQSLYPQPYYGADPLSPLPEQQPPQQMMPQQMMPQQAMPQQAPIPAKSGHKGLFPGKDIASILGILGDSMMAYGGMQPAYGPMVARRREADADRNFQAEKLAMEAEARRRERLETPYRTSNSAGDVVEIFPDGRTNLAYMDPYGKNQYQVVDNPATGGKEIMPTGTHPRPNQQHIQHLMQSGDKQNFDAKFGPGAADYILRQMGGR